MQLADAIALIRPGVEHHSGTWADIGAGTGMFTRALMHVLEEGVVYAVDKSPHALWQLQPTAQVELKIVEADFNNRLDLPPLDGIIMANALHYAKDPIVVLENVLSPLKLGGTFILIEYETEVPRQPWVPFPISFQRFVTLCSHVHLSPPEFIGTIASQYGYEHIYAAKSIKQLS